MRCSVPCYPPNLPYLTAVPCPRPAKWLLRVKESGHIDAVCGVHLGAKKRGQKQGGLPALEEICEWSLLKSNETSFVEASLVMQDAENKHWMAEMWKAIRNGEL